MQPKDTGLCVCDHVSDSHTTTTTTECNVCSCSRYIPKQQTTTTNTVPSITDVYAYIRTEIAYYQRRHAAAVQQYKRNHWYERWATLYDAGVAFGMVNLPNPDDAQE
jgi:hypothetical protein